MDILTEVLRDNPVLKVKLFVTRICQTTSSQRFD